MRRAITYVLIVVTAAAAGCAARAPTGASGRIAVVAGFYPLYEAAVRVGDGRVLVSNLTPAGAEPHDLELSPRQLDGLLGARVVVLMGRGFQPALESAVQHRTRGTIELLNDLHVDRHGTVTDVPGRGLDPHVWLDPLLMVDVVEDVAQGLERVDPSHTSDYERGAREFVTQLHALDRRYAAGLAHCRSNVIVTSHAAFGYMARRYGLTQEAIAGLAPEAEPDPKRLTELATLVRRDGVTTIFTETLVSPKVAESLAREVHVATAVLDPIEGLTKEAIDRGENYVTVMDANLRTLRTALGCA